MILKYDIRICSIKLDFSSMPPTRSIIIISLEREIIGSCAYNICFVGPIELHIELHVLSENNHWSEDMLKLFIVDVKC